MSGADGQSQGASRETREGSVPLERVESEPVGRFADRIRLGASRGAYNNPFHCFKGPNHRPMIRQLSELRARRQGQTEPAPKPTRMSRPPQVRWLVQAP